MGGIWLIGTPVGLSGTSGERKGPPKGIFCPKRCSFGGPSSAVEVFEEAGAHGMDTAQPDRSASGPAPELSNLPTVEPNLPTKARKRHFRHFRDKKCVIEAFELGNGNTCK